MSMYNDYEFEVKAAHPSGLLSYQSGKASSSRTFVVSCKYAEELALRALGKFRQRFPGTEYLSPILPAPFPFDTGDNSNSGQIGMVATGFTIEPLCTECFNADRYDGSGSDLVLNQGGIITDITASEQMEKYYFNDRDELTLDDEQCLCKVVITYEENPCDCVSWDIETSLWVVHSEILPGTCISVERNPAYEMFTLPNAGLVWKNIYDSQGDQVQLKADSYAYKIIPKADIIVHWHNVPVAKLCQIESHLVGFRGTVNNSDWGLALQCIDEVILPDDETQGCSLYEPETILFVDWQEDRSRRTDAFSGNLTGVSSTSMDTTTLKLVFKQKRIEIDFGTSGSNASVSDDDAGIAGWNHLFTDNDIEQNTWMRVVVKSTQKPIFPLSDFSSIFYPVL